MAIKSIHQTGLEINDDITLSADWGVDGDIVVNRFNGEISQKSTTWNALDTLTAPIGAIHHIGEAVDSVSALGDSFGANADIAVDKPNGIIYQKADGSWGLASSVGPTALTFSEESDGSDGTNIVIGGLDSPASGIDMIGVIFSPSSSTILEEDNAASTLLIASTPGAIQNYDSSDTGVFGGLPFPFYWRAAWWNSVTGRVGGYTAVYHWVP